MSAVKSIFLAALLLVAPSQSRDNSLSDVPSTDRRVEESQPSEIRWATHYLTEGVATRLTGPNGRLRIEFRGENLRIRNPGGQAINLSVLPPASVLWSPDGRSVAINNGNGSGQISHIMIVSDRWGLSIVDGVEDRLKAYFIEQTRCRIEPSDVSVGPEGWGSDGSTIWVRFESWSREGYCDSEPVHFAQYDVVRGVVMAHLSFAEAMERFCPQQAFRHDFEPNCREYEDRR